MARRVGLAAGGEQAARGRAPGVGADLPRARHRRRPARRDAGRLRRQPGEPGRGVLRRRGHAGRAQLGRLRHRRRGAAAGVPAEGPGVLERLRARVRPPAVRRDPAELPGAVRFPGRIVGGQHRGHAARGVPGRLHGRRRPGRGRGGALGAAPAALPHVHRPARRRGLPRPGHPAALRAVRGRRGAAARRVRLGPLRRADQGLPGAGARQPRVHVHPPGRTSRRPPSPRSPPPSPRASGRSRCGRRSGAGPGRPRPTGWRRRRTARPGCRPPRPGRGRSACP